MRTLTVNFKIVTSTEGDEHLGEVISHVLKQMAVHPEIEHGTYANGNEFKFHHTLAGRKSVEVFSAVGENLELGGVFVDIPAQTFEATVTATYENVYDPPLPKEVPGS